MILLDYKDRRPIYEQVVERFQELMVREVLKEDDQLPSVRNLAMDLSINPNTIQRAYAELERQGFIYSIKGKGSFVAENSNIKTERTLRIFEDIEQLTQEAKMLGVTEEELQRRISLVYDRGGEEA